MTGNVKISRENPYGCAYFPNHGERLRKDGCLEYHSFLKNYQSFFTCVLHTQNFEIQVPKGSHLREVFRGFAV
jgi:hypothetical protein